MMNRRMLVRGGAAFGALGPLLAGAPGRAAELDFSSDLIYLSPQRSDGSDSRCQAEIWFAAVDSDLFVVTASGAWRARAIERGLSGARIWVGDVGQWRGSGGAYRALPQLLASGGFERDPAMQARVLERMGQKYSGGWRSWGPRFRKGLADGSRVMLRYRPMT